VLLLARYRGWFLLAALQLADIVTTAYALNVKGAQEGNTTAAGLMHSYGQPTAYLVKAAAVGLLMLALWHYRARSWSRVLLVTALFMSAFAVVNNVGWLVAAG
jgi:uncharacterized membrane protein YiaA